MSRLTNTVGGLALLVSACSPSPSRPISASYERGTPSEVRTVVLGVEHGYTSPDGRYFPSGCKIQVRRTGEPVPRMAQQDAFEGNIAQPLCSAVQVGDSIAYSYANELKKEDAGASETITGAYQFSNLHLIRE